MKPAWRVTSGLAAIGLFGAAACGGGASVSGVAVTTVPSPVASAVTSGPSGRPDAQLAGGVTWSNGKGPRMRRVSAGTLLAGEEGQGRRVSIAAFWMDETEVTQGQYALCETAGKCQSPYVVAQGMPSSPEYQGGPCSDVLWHGSGAELHPITCVDWDKAKAFCEWAGKRLPTELEWEYAARGSDGRSFPWGNQPPTPTLANGCGLECAEGHQPSLYLVKDAWPLTAPVGSFPAGRSPFGLLDMAGNVWEWTADEVCAHSRDNDPNCEAKGRTMRGGGWNSSSPDELRADSRWPMGGREWPPINNYVGIRCASSETGAQGGGGHPPMGQLTPDVDLPQIPRPLPVPEDVAAAPAVAKRTPSGLAYRILMAGKGRESPKVTDRVRVHYSGWTKNGKMFDSSLARGEPTEFPVNGVIRGWTEGLQLMKVGDKARFWIPADLAYGDHPSRQGTPAGQLTFDVELIAVIK